MEKQGDNKRSVARVFAGNNKLLENVLETLVNVTLMLAKCNLPFRGSSEELSKDNKSNFLSIIQLLAKCRNLQLPKGSSNYLSPLIQNQLILLLAEEVFHDIKSELQTTPFFAIILDTTQDVSKKRPVK